MRSPYNILLYIVIIYFFGGVSLASEPEPPVQESVFLTTQRGRYELRVEIAETPEAQATGLMYRETIPEMTGMLFAFGVEQPVAMWMKDTPASLDMLFLDRVGKVVFVQENTVPYSLDAIGPREPVFAVLEVSAGTAAALGITSGDHAEHRIFGRRRALARGEGSPAATPLIFSRNTLLIHTHTPPPEQKPVRYRFQAEIRPYAGAQDWFQNLGQLKPTEALLITLTPADLTRFSWPQLNMPVDTLLMDRNGAVRAIVPSTPPSSLNQRVALDGETGGILFLYAGLAGQMQLKPGDRADTEQTPQILGTPTPVMPQSAPAPAPGDIRPSP